MYSTCGYDPVSEKTPINAVIIYELNLQFSLQMIPEFMKKNPLDDSFRLIKCVTDVRSLKLYFVRN